MESPQVDPEIDPEIDPHAVEMFFKGLDTGYKRGLWVYGPRGAGTTAAVQKLVTEAPERLPEGLWVHKRGAPLERNIKEQWRLERLLGANGSDFPLWEEATALESKLNDFWNCDVMWLDDLYVEMDVDFVRKHILTRIDDRVKSKKVKITLVSGEASPGHYGPGWKQVINDRFVVCRLEADDPDSWSL